MYKIAVVSIFLLVSTLGSPVPQVEEGKVQTLQNFIHEKYSNSESGSKAIFTLFSQLAGVVQKTGDVISQLSKNDTDVPELSQAAERVIAHLNVHLLHSNINLIAKFVLHNVQVGLR